MAAHSIRPIAVFAAWLAAITTIYSIVVRCIDPRTRFGTHIFPAVAMNTRVARMELFKTYQEHGPVTGLILGSSRSMQLRPAEFQTHFGGRFFNFSVTSGKAEDFLAIYKWVLSRGVHPRILVIGVDVESLSDSMLPEDELLVTPPLSSLLDEQGMAKLGASPRLWEPIREWNDTFTASYLLDSMRSVNYVFRPRSSDLESEPDGHRRYRFSDSLRAAGTFDLNGEIQKTLPAAIQLLESMQGLAPRRAGYLEQLVRLANKDGARVALFLTTYHPLIVDYCRTRPRVWKRWREIRAYVSALKSYPGVRTFDLTEVSSYAGSSDNWYDAIHIDDVNAARLVAQMFRQE